MGTETQTIAPNPFTLWLPIDMEKSVSVDSGERAVCGIISTEDPDLEGEQIMEQLASYNPMLQQMGKNLNAALADQVDWDRFSKSQGWLKWEHDPEPESIVGWPERIEKGVIYNDPVTGMKKSGTAMWGQLFPASASMRKSDAAWNLIQAIRKSGVKRRLGYSIEGAYVPLKNLPAASKACMVTNVVLTTKPVNSWAWADMAKALVAGAGVTDSAQLAGGGALRKQSLWPNVERTDIDDKKKKKKCDHETEDGLSKSVEATLTHLVICKGIPLPAAKLTVLKTFRRAA